MTNEEFQNLVLSKVKPGKFQPMVIYDPDNDSLEVLISDESYREEKTGDRFFVVYCGRESGDVTGVLIRRFTELVKDMEDVTPDIRLEIETGKFKVVHLFKAIREKSRKGKMTLGVLIKRLEEVAEECDLEANLCGCASDA